MKITQNDAIMPRVRSIDLSENEDKMLVGTFGSEIYELIADTQIIGEGKNWTVKCLMRGHYTPNPLWTNEVWGLCVYNDDEDQFLTCSDDATLRLYSAADRKMIRYLDLCVDKKGKPLKWKKIKGFKGRGMPLQCTARAVGISPNSGMIVVGMKNGVVYVIKNESKFKIKRMFRPSKEEISDIKFNPAGDRVAIGSHDNKIRVYSIDKYLKKKVCRPLNKHSSYITHLDWSEDGEYLHSNCGAYEILFWEVAPGL